MELKVTARPSGRAGPAAAGGVQDTAGLKRGVGLGFVPMLPPAPSRRRCSADPAGTHTGEKPFSGPSAAGLHHQGQPPGTLDTCGITTPTSSPKASCLGGTVQGSAGGDGLKFSETFQKDLAAQIMNGDPNIWNQDAAGSEELAIKKNEIFIIQDTGFSHIPGSFACCTALLGTLGGKKAQNSPPTVSLDKSPEQPAQQAASICQVTQENKEMV